jgi:hypothetical protein
MHRFGTPLADAQARVIKNIAGPIEAIVAAATTDHLQPDSDYWHNARPS